VLPPEARPASRLRPSLLGLVTGLAIGLAILLGATLRDRARLQRAAAGVAAANHATASASRRNAIVRAVEIGRRSVVTVRVTGAPRAPTELERLFWYPFDVGGVRQDQWWGSGFVIDARGYVLTNEHVVRGARDVVVSLGDDERGGSLPATIVGTAPEFDLALLRLPPDFAAWEAGFGSDSLVVPARLGDSDGLLLGESAIAIGSPFGQQLGSIEPSVSVGVVSALRRDVPPPDETTRVWPYFKMIQTDAIINEGNSGGPLLNADGEVVGVNTIKLANTNRLNFSIPINTVKWVWQELRDYGEVRKPWVGWVVEEMPLEVRRQLQLPEEEGVLTVARVVPGSPAETAGIRAGDVLLAIQGLAAYSLARAERIVFGAPIDGRIEVELLRDGHPRRVLVRIAEDPTARAEREARARERVG